MKPTTSLLLTFLGALTTSVFASPVQPQDIPNIEERTYLFNAQDNANCRIKVQRLKQLNDPQVQITDGICENDTVFSLITISGPISVLDNIFKGDKIARRERSTVISDMEMAPMEEFTMDSESTLQRRGNIGGIKNWALGKISEGDQFIYPESAGKDIVVYVVDSGINVNHPEIRGRAIFGQTFLDPQYRTSQDTTGHGTAVAGIIGGETYGVAKKATLVGVQVVRSDGTTDNIKVMQALNWIAKDQARHKKTSIINLSLGIPAGQLFSDIMNNLYNRGIYVVAAAGNMRSDACSVSPANDNHVITVAASDFNDRFAYYSNYGKCVNIIAPGTSVPTAVKSGGIGNFQGTSFAAPYVAGTLALIEGEKKFRDVAKGTDFLYQISKRGVIKGNPDQKSNLFLNTKF